MPRRVPLVLWPEPWILWRFRPFVPLWSVVSPPVPTVVALTSACLALPCAVLSRGFRHSLHILRNTARAFSRFRHIAGHLVGRGALFLHRSRNRARDVVDLADHSRDASNRFNRSFGVFLNSGDFLAGCPRWPSLQFAWPVPLLRWQLRRNLCPLRRPVPPRWSHSMPADWSGCAMEVITFNDFLANLCARLAQLGDRSVGRVRAVLDGFARNLGRFAGVAGNALYRRGHLLRPGCHAVQVLADLLRRGRNSIRLRRGLLFGITGAHLLELTVVSCSGRARQ